MYYIINGSPRSGWNTDKLLENVQRGMVDAGGEVTRVDLFDLQFSGCKGCLACKRKTENGANLGHCVLRDDLRETLEGLNDAEGVVIGSPIYFWGVTGAMRNFLERFLFCHMLYTHENDNTFTKEIPSGIVLTCGVPADAMADRIEAGVYGEIKAQMKRMMGKEPLVLVNGCANQFDNPSKYHADLFVPERIADNYENVFLPNCQRAYEMGRSIVEQK